MTDERGLLAWTETVFASVAQLSLACIAMVVVADVVSRYAFNSPLLFADDLTQRFLLVAVVYLALSSGEAAGVHVRVTVLTRMMPPTLARVSRVATLLLSALYFAGITVFSGVEAAHAWEIHQTSAGVIPWPMYVAYTIVPVGTLLMTVRLLRKAAGNELVNDDLPPAGEPSEETIE